jgi:chromosome partitioning protein
MVARARQTRKKVCGRNTEWIVVRNRMSASSSRNERQVSDVLDYVREQFGFRTVPGLRERVIFRELFPAGLTVFDPMEIPNLDPEYLGADLAARSEITQVLADAGLLEPQSSAANAAADKEASGGLSEALVRFAPPGLRAAAAGMRSRRAASPRRRGS